MKLFLFACLLWSLASPPIVAQEAKAPSSATEAISPELMRVEEIEEDNFFRYRDNFFLLGRPNTKVQFSFKMRPVLGTNFYFAYTQIMFWKITSDSRPFSDINFNPEVFYEWNRPDTRFDRWRLGLEHKSNGKEGEASRSIDRVFVEMGLQFGWRGYQILWDTRAFWIYDLDWETNAEIRQYTGFWYSRIAIDGLVESVLPIKGEVYAQFFPGGEQGDKLRYGGIEAGLKFRARFLGVMPYIMLQYYYGYMESMLDYKEATRSYRIGFLL